MKHIHFGIDQRMGDALEELSVKPSLPPSKVFKIMTALLEPSAFFFGEFLKTLRILQKSRP